MARDPGSFARRQLDQLLTVTGLDPAHVSLHTGAPMTAPRIGDQVIYVAHGTPIRPDGTQAFPAAERAAVITEVDPNNEALVGLIVMNPTGLFFHPLAAGGCQLHLGEGPYGPWPGGTWHPRHPA